jgi:GNAT superfamily N-acetyltransferase
MTATPDSINAGEFQISPLRFRSAEEYAALLRVRADAFTSWYADAGASRFPLLARLRLNALSECFPELFIEARTEQGESAGWRFCLPTRWNGDVESLGTYNAHRAGRIGRLASWSLTAAHIARSSVPLIAPIHRAVARRVRRGWLDGSNTMLLAAMFVLPKFRGHHVSELMLAAAIGNARKLGLRHIISALRPIAYGEHKVAWRTGYNPDDFAAYVFARRPDGLPVDPLLRIYARAGARFLKSEPRSFTVTKPRSVFEEFKRAFKPDSWYEAAPGQWECGMTQSWFVNGDTVTSVEPELWCEFPLT